MMNLGKGIDVLELTANFAGNEMKIHPVVLHDENNVVLVDTGMPGMLSQIRSQLSAAGLSLDTVNKVVLTHQDIDHIGGLPELLAAASHKVNVYAHEVDKPYIEGEKTLIKWNPERMKGFMSEPPKAPVDVTVADGEVLPICGGVTVIYTPGHTPGHISLYVNESKVLITGDAMVAPNGELKGPNPQNTPDMETALKSLQKFTPFDVATVVCYHGGIVTDHVNEQLAALAR